MNLDVFLAFSDMRVRFTQVAKPFPYARSMLHCGEEFALPCGANWGLDPRCGALPGAYVPVSLNANRV